MEQQCTSSSYKGNFQFEAVIKQPYLTREEWEVYTAAELTHLTLTRRALLMQLEAIETRMAAMGQPLKRPRGEK